MCDVGADGFRAGLVRRRSLDRVDHLLTCPFPAAASGSAQMRDAFVGILAGLLVDAGHLNVCHSLLLVL